MNYTYKELKELLLKANKAYYKEANSFMSDYEYDIKLKELERMEQEQGFRDNDSPTISVGSDLSVKNEKNTHTRPMLSLKNSYSMEDVEKWYDDMRKATGEDEPEVVINPKWDGMSGALRYDENGSVYKALTRGDGTIGEDISQNIQYCQNNIWSPKKLFGRGFIGEARGEIIMTTAGFNELNSEGIYQNARNLVSGTLKLLNLSDFVPRASSIKFLSYWLEDSDNKKYSDDLRLLENYNFEVGPYYTTKSLENIKNAINIIKNSKYDVAIDGAVIKLNEKKYWNLLGNTAKFPRWAIAYKYEQESKTTKITKITFECARTGKITPLAWFEPVFIDGSTIQKATLNNQVFYDNLDIAINDTVEVCKFAAIIPGIKSVIERPTHRLKVPFPKKCPSCGSILVKHNEEHNDWYCDNVECKSRIVDKIINYTHMLEIDGFADIIAERLHSIGLLSSIEDIYKLKNHKNEILELDRFGEKLLNKLLQNIENQKKTDFWRLLAGLGIPNVGPKTAKILAKKFKNMKVLQAATKEDFLFIEDIGDITAENLINWFKNKENRALILFLEKEGQNMKVEESTEKAQINLEGKTFCITGKLSLPRDQYIELIESLGGKVSGAVSNKTSYLITNDKTTNTNKNITARQLSIPILNEKELLKMCDALELLKELK